MPRKPTREEQPATSNRGRADAPGVFVIFAEQDEEEPENGERREDEEALGRDEGD
jgi:hypothetical protein